MMQALSLSTKPHLPLAEAILPYLRRIDGSRWYSNFGPLVREFEARLEARFASEVGSIVTVANATTGLTLALQDLGIGFGTCLLPAWTFVASVVAVTNAALTPYFVDVDPQSWQLTPAIARQALKTAKDVKAVLVVAPFGASVDMEAWAHFADETNISVVVDNAAGFDMAQTHTRLVSVVSLHATKVLGVGEGGFILAGTSDRADRLRRMSNFGLNGARESIYPGVNGKLSEYGAAVGLAALDEWPASRQKLLDRAASYRAHIIASGLLAHLDVSAQDQASMTFNVVLRQPQADDLIAFLQRQGIGARKWWGEGCHRHPMFENYARTDLATTDELVRKVVALPFWIDMSEREIESVVENVTSFFAQSSDARENFGAIVRPNLTPSFSI
jgi:dTDP-4-amino-4,6-dideoxygalactose transaminase